MPSAYQPVSVMADTFGTGILSDEQIEKLIMNNFDLRPGAIIRDLDLRRPLYRQVASYGHLVGMNYHYLGRKSIKRKY